MEDILEEIVGEIEGEYDLPDDTLTRVDDHTLLVAGSITIDDFNEAIGTQLPRTVRAAWPASSSTPSAAAHGQATPSLSARSDWRSSDGRAANHPAPR